MNSLVIGFQKKSWWIKTLILSGFGIVLSTVMAHTSISYNKAKHFLITDQAINKDYGGIDMSILYSWRIKEFNSDAHFLTKGDFTFYVIGDAKNGTVKIHSESENGIFKVYKK